MDARWQASEPQLVAAIRDEILAAPGQRITFARFMERALTEPDLGYYAVSLARPTREGDFLTAPELHPFFGRCVGRFVAAAWDRAGRPGRWLVREHGAGGGRLRDDVSAGLAADGSALAGLLRWELADLPDRPARSDPPADMVVANELLDALPVHRVVRDRGELLEVWVGWRDGWFTELRGAPSTPALAARLADDGVALGDGQRAEVCLAADDWVAAAAPELAPGGILLVIDYGHEAAELYGPRRMAGSLLTYRAHAVADDPFAAVGRSDITAHVDLTALARSAAQAGLVPLGRTTQARFVADLGLAELLGELGRDPATDLPTYLAARSAVARLLDPRHLGAYAVLVWRRAPFPGGRDAPLPGFRAPA